MAGFFVTDARREGKPFLFAVALIAALGGFLLADAISRRWTKVISAVMPYGPRWLVERGREDEAKEVLRRTHEEQDVDHDAESIKKIVAESGRLRDLIGPSVRPMLIVGLGLAIFQQIVGINAIFLVSFTFLSLAADIGKAATFWLYAGIGVLAIIFFVLRVPETKGRSLEDIQRDVTGSARPRHRHQGKLRSP